MREYIEHKVMQTKQFLSEKNVVQLTAQSSEREEAIGELHYFYVLHQCAASRPWPWFEAQNMAGIFDMKFRW